MRVNFFFLENKAIFVFDGNQEGILRAIHFYITSAVVLNFNNDGFELAYLTV